MTYEKPEVIEVGRAQETIQGSNSLTGDHITGAPGTQPLALSDDEE